MRRSLAIVLASLATLGGMAALLASRGHASVSPTVQGLGAACLTLGLVIGAMVAGGPLSAPDSERA